MPLSLMGKKLEEFDVREVEEEDMGWQTSKSCMIRE